MRSATCRFQQIFAHSNTELSLLIRIISPWQKKNRLYMALLSIFENLL